MNFYSKNGACKIMGKKLPKQTNVLKDKNVKQELCSKVSITE